VAEGVEALVQLEHLRALGCEHAQGFFFSKPVTAVDAGSLIAIQPWRGLRGSGMAVR
jgi:EAL domain-containing protein (putative c-di-GMP-specific phosphodiesterase class I)